MRKRQPPRVSPKFIKIPKSHSAQYDFMQSVNTAIYFHCVARQKIITRYQPKKRKGKGKKKSLAWQLRPVSRLSRHGTQRERDRDRGGSGGGSGEDAEISSTNQKFN